MTNNNCSNISMSRFFRLLILTLVSSFLPPASTQEFLVPPNDQCEDAILLEPSHNDPTMPTIIGSTVNATSKVLSCEAVALPTVYYQLQGTGGRMRLSTCTAETTTTFDATIVVDDGACEDNIGCVQVDGRESLPCDDDDQPFGETIEFRTQENTTYTIAVRGATPEATGTFGLVAFEYLRPDNDVCTAPVALDYSIEEIERIEVYSTTENSTFSYFDCLAEPLASAYYTMMGNGKTMFASTCYGDRLEFNSSIYERGLAKRK